MPRSLLIAVLLGAFAVGCDTVEKAGPQPTPAAADTAFELDVPQIMRGTVGAETVILGYPQAGVPGDAEVVVRGYGLVVGLDGTGSRDVPPALRAHMLAEMSRRGVGSRRTGWDGVSPTDLLDSPETAVAIVEAVVPPGAKAGDRFDVRIFADPNSGTTSLDGGRLWTTDLRPGPLRVGGGQAFAIAEAAGPIFLNPFADAADTARDTVDRTAGRILDGGVAIRDMPLKLRLATPGHARARAIESAINTRFPRERGQRDTTARGESDEIIALTVPPSFRSRTAEFVALVQHTTIRPTRPESVAMSVRRSVEANPGFAPAGALRWQALGVKSLAVIREIYDAPDELVRLGALAAGAKLDDALVIPPLVEMADEGSFESRRQAIELLAGMRIEPRIDAAITRRLDDEDVEIRLAAYDALVRRGGLALDRTFVDDDFILDVVDSQVPMIYITQSGEPRIVLFGRDLRLRTPLVSQAWSNQLMLKADTAEGPMEVYYRDEQAETGSVHEVDPALAEFIRFLAHTTTVEDPKPGLGFGYARTIGAIHRLWRQGHIAADFKAEQDRILAQILRQERDTDVIDRPEFGTAPPPVDPFAPPPMPEPDEPDRP